MGSISKKINYSKEKRSWINSNGISDLPLTLRGHRVVYDSRQKTPERDVRQRTSA